MPFDAAEVARQIEQSRGGVQTQGQEREEAIELAVRIYREADETAWEQRVQDATLRRWVGMPVSALHDEPPAGVFAGEYCVTATDSSFIPPDKHRGSFSHLINVGRVMLKYGLNPSAELDNTPNHETEAIVEGDDSMTGRLLQSRCALRELEELLEWSRKYRPDVALVDGSLMQLVLVLSKEEQVRALMREYFKALHGFREIGVPVIGYISQPASQMVMRAIRMLACDKPQPCEKRPETECGCKSLWSIDDSDLFWRTLDNGQRSAIFSPQFSYLDEQDSHGIREMVFAYLGTEYEVSRIEFPAWVADDGLLDRTISILLHQGKLGRGYPNCLTLAHQFAALHNGDRESYYFLLERAGLLRKTSEKAIGKRAIGQAI